MYVAFTVSVLKYIEKGLYLDNTSPKDWADKLQIITALQVIELVTISAWLSSNRRLQNCLKAI
jgi:hypothetical protein